MNDPARNHSLWLGLALVVVGTAGLLFSSQIAQPSLTNEHDPGARLFPLILAGGLLAGGLHELIRYVLARPGRLNTVLRERWTDRPHRNALLLLAALVLYLPLLQWIGFLAASFLLAACAGTLLGARFRTSLLCAVVLTATVKLLFGVGFKVAFPEGPFGF